MFLELQKVNKISLTCKS